MQLANTPGEDFATAIAEYLDSPVHYFYDLFGAYPEGYVPPGFVLWTPPGQESPAPPKPELYIPTPFGPGIHVPLELIGVESTGVS